MSIKVTNDGKEKHQSWEAKLEQSGSDGKGHYDTLFVGYGINEYEARTNILQQVDNLIKNLKRIKDEIIED